MHRHVQHADGLADRAVLRRHVGERRVAAPALWHAPGSSRSTSNHSGYSQPDDAVKCAPPAASRSWMTERRTLRADQRVPGRERGVAEQRPQLLDGAVLPEPAAGLEGLGPVHGHAA